MHCQSSQVFVTEMLLNLLSRGLSMHWKGMLKWVSVKEQKMAYMGMLKWVWECMQKCVQRNMQKCVQKHAKELAQNWNLSQKWEKVLAIMNWINVNWEYEAILYYLFNKTDLYFDNWILNLKLLQNSARIGSKECSWLRQVPQPC